MASKSKNLRKLEKAIADGDERLRPQLRRRLRAMEKLRRELQRQIRQLHAIRTMVKRAQVPLLYELDLSRKLSKTIRALDAELAEAVKAKAKDREKELVRRMRRRDADAQSRLKDVERRAKKADEIEDRWEQVCKELLKLSKSP